MTCSFRGWRRTATEIGKGDRAGSQADRPGATGIHVCTQLPALPATGDDEQDRFGTRIAIRLSDRSHARIVARAWSGEPTRMVVPFPEVILPTLPLSAKQSPKTPDPPLEPRRSSL